MTDPNHVERPGQCPKRTTTLRAMLHVRKPLLEHAQDLLGYRCFMSSGHTGPCASWGPDGAPWIHVETGA